MRTRNEVVNQRGETVLVYTPLRLVARRPEGAPAEKPKPKPAPPAELRGEAAFEDAALLEGVIRDERGVRLAPEGED